MENEKAVASIPSTAAGVVAKIYVKPGEKVTVGQRLLSLTGGEPSSATVLAAKDARPEPATEMQAANAAAAAGGPIDRTSPSCRKRMMTSLSSLSSLSSTRPPC